MDVTFVENKGISNDVIGKAGELEAGAYTDDETGRGQDRSVEGQEERERGEGSLL